MLNCKEVLKHVRECQECRDELKQLFAEAAIERRVELLVDEDGLLPFSY